MRYLLLLTVLIFSHVQASSFAMDSYQEPVKKAAEEGTPDVRITKGLIHPVECWTCQGAGRVKSDCEYCAGSGLENCSSCTHFSFFELRPAMKRLLAIQLVIAPKQAEQLREARVKLAEQVEKSTQQLAQVGWVNPPDGFVRCPNGCLGGKSLIAHGAECKVCKGKGELKCMLCKGKIRRDCVVCKGKRQVLSPCPECSGGGKGNDPLARTNDANSCPWCNDARIRNCGSCDAEVAQEYKCKLCAGSGKQVCVTCAGYKKDGCRKCSGTGDLSGYYGNKTSNRCDQCSGKGVQKCNSCSGGKIACTMCKGSKKQKGNCRACLGKLVAPCEGCWYSSGLAWTVTADRLFAAGKGEEAVQHMDVGIGRAYLARAEQLNHFGGDPAELKTLKRELDKEIKALERRFEDMKKSAKSD